MPVIHSPDSLMEWHKQSFVNSVKGQAMKANMADVIIISAFIRLIQRRSSLKANDTIQGFSSKSRPRSTESDAISEDHVLRRCYFLIS